MKELKPLASELKPWPGQTQEQAAANLLLRLAAQAPRNEKIRSGLENFHSVRGLDAPRVPADRVSERVRLRKRS